ncbi:serine-rich adhesin for platelets-like isoform X2 [Haliotis cracherodii]|uniref:serine-rich adhesin for platelets-like isoform X2 n=1 Tax=Haliotis cracherodii TaxID=6455 RepID=UPI0039EB4609
MELSSDGHTITRHSESELAETRPPDVSVERTNINKHDVRSKYTSSSPVESGSQSGVADGHATGSNCTGVNNGQMQTTTLNVSNIYNCLPHTGCFAGKQVQPTTSTGHRTQQPTESIPDITDGTTPCPSTGLRDGANGCELCKQSLADDSLEGNAMLNETSSSPEANEKVSDDEFGDRDLTKTPATQAVALEEQASSENISDNYRNICDQMRTLNTDELGEICLGLAKRSLTSHFPIQANLSQSGSILCKDTKRSSGSPSIDMSGSVTTTPEKRVDKTSLEEEAADEFVPSSNSISQESESNVVAQASVFPKRGREDSMKRSFLHANLKIEVDLKDIQIQLQVKTKFNILRTVHIAELCPDQLNELYHFLDDLVFREVIMNRAQPTKIDDSICCCTIIVDLSGIPDTFLCIDTRENIEKIVYLAQYQPSQTKEISSFIHEIYIKLRGRIVTS